MSGSEGFIKLENQLNLAQFALRFIGAVKRLDASCIVHSIMPQ